MRLLKSARTQERLIAFGTAIMVAYLRLVLATSRFSYAGNTDLQQRARAGNASFIMCSWHSRLIMVTHEAQNGLKAHGIASRSEDGDLAARLLIPFGIGLIRGSSANPRKPSKDKGGAAALVGAIAFLRKTDDAVVALTPDGPRGPRGRCHHGVATMSIRSGKPVVPMAWASRHAIGLSTWDRFLVPLPFSRITIVWGPEITPPPRDAMEAEFEPFRLRIEAAITDVTREADRIAGRRAVFTPEEAAA